MNNSPLLSTLVLLAAFATGCAKTSATQRGPAAGGDLLGGGQWQYRLGSRDWQNERIEVPSNYRGWAAVRVSFDVSSEVLDKAVCFELEQPTDDDLSMMDIDYRLNGRPVAPQLRERRFFLKTLRNIPTDLLKTKGNELRFKVPVSTGAEPKAFLLGEMTLRAMTPQDLAIITGPIVGAFDDEGVWITCRTNIPAEVTLEAKSHPALREGGQDDSAARFVSVSSNTSDGLSHRLHVSLAEDEAAVVYTLRAVCRDVTRQATGEVKFWQTGQPLRFVIHGDVQNNPAVWSRISRAIVDEQPAFVACVGDMVEDGLCEWRWDREFFSPAAEMFATIPYYPTVGNHDVGYHSDIQNTGADCPLLDDFFVTPPGPRRNWSQEFDDVLLIGIAAHENFSPGSVNYRWLENLLADSDAKYIFLVGHYQAFASEYYGVLPGDGSKPRWYLVTHHMATFVVPLLVKYNATALICGHAHYYQRSETPEGFTQVLTGNAGAGSSKGSSIPKGNNRYAVTGYAGPHYCVFEVTDGGCVMTVKTAEGQVIDTRTFQPRQRQ